MTPAPLKAANPPPKGAVNTGSAVKAANTAPTAASAALPPPASTDVDSNAMSRDVQGF